MKKRLIFCVLFGVLLISCSSASSNEISLEEAKPIIQQMYDSNLKDQEQNAFYSHIYFIQEETTEEDIKKNEVIYCDLEAKYIHQEYMCIDDNNKMKSKVAEDIFVKKDTLQYYRSVEIGKRVSKSHFSCSLDYVYSRTHFNELFEVNLYENFYENLLNNLNKDKFVKYFSSLNYSVQNEYGISHQHQDGFKSYYNSAEDTLTLKCSYKIDEESEEYNLNIESYEIYQNNLVKEVYDKRYFGDYDLYKYDYEKVLKIPTFSDEEYETINPTLLTLYRIYVFY